jgi:tetratricopeptide (TPR) repeat protein
MRTLIRVFLIVLFCVGVAVGVVLWLVDLAPRTSRQAGRPLRSNEPREASQRNLDVVGSTDAQKRSVVYDIILDGFEDGGYKTATQFMIPIRNLASLQELREAVRGRGRRGISTQRAQLGQLQIDTPPTHDQVLKKLSLEQSIGFLYMYEGKFLEAASWLEKALETSQAPHVPVAMQIRLTAVLGIVAMRRGEIENCLECVGPSSCIFPIAREAVHQNQAGSREAIRWFSRYLESSPRDLRVLWLLNIAYMTLGEHPEKIPSKYRISTEFFHSSVDMGRFTNVASLVGLTARGPNLAGGSVFDDFNGDGLADLFSTSLDADLGASLYINLGNGTFDDRSASAGLGDQVYALNVTRADFDNDGDLDLLLLRGAWETPLRLSLLRNKGGGSFDDVTVSAGLAEPIASESAAWGDYDNDGLVDVFVCGEYLPPDGTPPSKPGDPRNRCRLYHNRGDGTFVNVAAQAGVTNERCGKGSSWGDYDGDGRLDLFVSNMGQPCRLYHNEGEGKFLDVAPKLGVTGTDLSFACWFWDYDNDGLLDLYVNDYRARVAEVLCSVMGVKIDGSSRPRLYRNLDSTRFSDVTKEVGLDRAMAPMGSNFGDVDNDGYLDIYLGTGDMSYEGLDVNLMFKNVQGERFEDVTTSSGTGHLQKGHGVSFADWDCDGDLDLFVELGGATPGDQGYNALFQNPGLGRHWLKIKLVGTKTNRAALGAKIRVDLRGPDKAPRSIYRTIGNNSSFGGNSLVESIGLIDLVSVECLSVSWPTSQTTQIFHNVGADQAIEITEGSDSFKVLNQPPIPFPPATR